MADDDESFIPGPLDELVPGLRKRAEKYPALPVHPRVVYARAPNGERNIVLASFAPAAGARALHAALKRLIEGVLLATVSRPKGELAEDERAPSALELYTFVAHPFDVTPALSPFALREAALDQPSAHAASALLRREAQLVEGLLVAEPQRLHRAPIREGSHPLAAALERALREHGPDAPWGSQPGALARVCADQLAQLGHAGVAPTRAGIERLEEVVVQLTPGAIRWMEPLSFQALCDLIAVTATVQYGRDVEWAVCDPDEETKLAPPPLIRVAGRGESFHVPLGEHVLRWCMMPRAEAEAIPTLGAWAEHEFAEES